MTTTTTSYPIPTTEAELEAQLAFAEKCKALYEAEGHIDDYPPYQQLLGYIALLMGMKQGAR